MCLHMCQPTRVCTCASRHILYQPTHVPANTHVNVEITCDYIDHINLKWTCREHQSVVGCHLVKLCHVLLCCHVCSVVYCIALYCIVMFYCIVLQYVTLYCNAGYYIVIRCIVLHYNVHCIEISCLLPLYCMHCIVINCFVL